VTCVERSDDAPCWRFQEADYGAHMLDHLGDSNDALAADSSLLSLHLLLVSPVESPPKAARSEAALHAVTS
jgi:hypothetical protein